MNFFKKILSFFSSKNKMESIPSKIIEINDKWNNSKEIRYWSDELIFGKVDYWQTPKEFIKNGLGDCEDFAIAKFFDLKKEGYDPWIVYCMDKTSGHAVCVVDDYILDLDRIYDLRKDKYWKYVSVYGFNLDEFKIFKEFKPTGRNLGVHNLKSWTNLLERMK
jgi:predicted transglutaminase-like cysteine proteinase